MNRTLSVAAAGMATQQAVLDSIAANLANVDVPGYRVNRADFSSFISPDCRAAAPELSGSHRLFTQGRLDLTNNPHDLAIEGQGFFVVRSSSGCLAYTRAGNFSQDASGLLRLPNGAALVSVKLPPGTTGFRVDEQGAVFAQIAGQRGDAAAGRITLATFANVTGLRFAADGMFYQTAAAGRRQQGTPAMPLGRIKQRYLERANLTVVAAMMAILAAQRAYEANAKVVQAADEMLRLANNLERG